MPDAASAADAPAADAPAPTLATALPVHRLTVAEYHALGRAGVFPDDARLELIDGLLIDMPPIGPDHAGRTMRLPRLFYRRLLDAGLDDVLVSVQGPLRLNDNSEPEPDLVLVRPTDDADRVPRASEALLVIEVADTTLATDRAEKVPRYAAAGVPETWVVALPEGVLDVYRGLTPEGYRTHHTLRPGDATGVEALPALGAFDVATVLGTPAADPERPGAEG
jgi:Uma2 family endonuclease